jgi:purine-binding chemotaxis protein CheW
MKPSPGPRKVLDAQQIRERLAQVAAATEATQRLSAEQAQAVLQQRALTLARPAAVDACTADLLEVVVFRLGSETCALEARFVREVVRLGDCTPLPGAPSFVVGVVNLRGEVLVVFDLRAYFATGERPAADHGCILVLGEDRAEFGVLADEARDIAVLTPEAILEPPGSIPAAARECVRGVTRDALLVLDGAALLHDKRLYIDLVEEQGA